MGSHEQTIRSTTIPLIPRYASRAMAELWSPQAKFSTWRRLWVALAEAERELGLNITAEPDRGAAGRRSRRSTSTPPRPTSGGSGTT